jgi:DNA-directed RNA polymerase subunit beta'
VVLQETFQKKINLTVKFDGVAEIEDLKTVKGEDSEGNAVDIVISRTSELKLIDKKSGITLSTNNIPYGSTCVC